MRLPSDPRSIAVRPIAVSLLVSMSASTFSSSVCRTVLALCAPLSAPFYVVYSTPSPQKIMSSSDFTHVNVPARIADLRFSYLKPADFQVMDLPDEKPDFEKPTSFFPLQVAMASYGVVLFSAGARPAFEDGSVQDWAEFLTRESGLKLVSLRPGIIGGVPVVVVETTQETDSVTMRMCTAFMEDGKRLLNLSVMAPDAIWASVEPMLQSTLSSFRLAEPRGSSTPLMRADLAKSASIPAAESPAPVDASATHPVVDDSVAASAPTPSVDLALATDAATLDPEHPMNVRLRDQGAGLTPRVLETNLAGKYAVVGAGAIAACFELPFGWHVIDDGRRTLVFDAGGKIQISLNLRRTDGALHAMLEQLKEEALQEQPQIEAQQLDFAADLPGLVLRNYRDGSDVLVQAFIARQLRPDGLTHVARITSAPDDAARAVNLAEVIIRSMGIPVATQ